MTDFSSHLSFAKATLRDACDCLQDDLFSGDTVCIRHLDRQASQFMVLVVTLGVMLVMAGMRAIIRM